MTFNFPVKAKILIMIQGWIKYLLPFRLHLLLPILLNLFQLKRPLHCSLDTTYQANSSLKVIALAVSPDWNISPRVLSPDQQHQSHLRNCHKYKVFSTIRDHWIKTLEVRPRNVYFNKLLGWFWCKLKFENHWYRLNS